MVGEKGYKGGTHKSTIVINGKTFHRVVKKDAYGNVTFESISPAIFGIF
mgnify:CR=1 FL=1